MKGFQGPRGGNQMSQMVKKMQNLQRQMEQTQQRIDETELEASAGGGVVKVKVNGKKEVLAIEIDPEVVDPEDTEMLADLLIVAVNDALQQAGDLNEKEMGKITGGMNIPGL